MKGNSSQNLNIRSEIFVKSEESISLSENTPAKAERTRLLATAGKESKVFFTASPRKSQPISPKYICLSYLITLKYVLSGKTTLSILDPSNGGIGMRLNIPSPIFIEKK